MRSRKAFVLICCALMVSGCAAIEEFIDSLPEPAPPATTATGSVASASGVSPTGLPSAGETVVVQGRMRGDRTVQEHRFQLPEGWRYAYLFNTAFPRAQGSVQVTLLEVDPVDPNDPAKWRRLENFQTDMGGERPLHSAVRPRSNRGEYVLRLESRPYMTPPEGQFQATFFMVAPHPVAGTRIAGNSLGIREIIEYRIFAPEGNRFTYSINTAFPGSTGTARVTLLEVDPVDPDDPDKWRRVLHHNGIEFGSERPTVSSVVNRSARGEYVVRIEPVPYVNAPTGQYSIDFEAFGIQTVRGNEIQADFKGGTQVLEYRITAPPGPRFTYNVNTAFPGGSGGADFTLLSVDPEDPDDPAKWRRVHNVRTGMGVEQPGVSGVLNRSTTGEYILRVTQSLSFMSTAGRFHVTFRAQ
jgi:hypothetical protein